MWHNIQHSYEEGTLGIPRLFDYFRYGYMNGRHLTEEEYNYEQKNMESDDWW